eukprot:g3970.t1
MEAFSLIDGGRNVLRGLQLVTEVMTVAEEREVCRWVLARCAEGRKGTLRRPVYLRAGGARSRGNRRQSLQYGGFFDFNKAAPGKASLVPAMPPILERVIDKLMADKRVGAAVLGGRPNQVIVNYYQRGDCIPPHTDHESYARPIVSLSMLSEQPMLLGTRFRCTAPSHFEPAPGSPPGAVSVPCPRRSLVVLDREAGDVAKHCVSACTQPRISLTFRRDGSARGGAAAAARGGGAARAAKPAKGRGHKRARASKGGAASHERVDKDAPDAGANTGGALHPRASTCGSSGSSGDGGGGGGGGGDKRLEGIMTMFDSLRQGQHLAKGKKRKRKRQRAGEAAADPEDLG